MFEEKTNEEKIILLTYFCVGVGLFECKTVYYYRNTNKYDAETTLTADYRLVIQMGQLEFYYCYYYRSVSHFLYLPQILQPTDDCALKYESQPKMYANALSKLAVLICQQVLILSWPR